MHSGGVRKPVEPLYTNADLVEVERLREGIAKHWKVICDQRAENESLRAQLAEAHALLRECQPCLEKAGYGTWQIDDLLSASAEPSASKCKCDIRTKLVGDGCEECNPTLAAELKEETPN